MNFAAQQKLVEHEVGLLKVENDVEFAHLRGNITWTELDNHTAMLAGLMWVVVSTPIIAGAR